MPVRPYYVHGQKRLCKIEYGFEGTISDFDLGLFYPNNQLMFSFVKFWLCYMLNHLVNVTRNWDMLVGFSNIDVNVIVNHVQHFAIIRAFFLPGGLVKFFSAWGIEKQMLICYFLGGSLD